jgi:hypothetical protein
MLADDDRPPPGGRYALHRRTLVPVAAIRLDVRVWEWVRHYLPRVAAEPEVEATEPAVRDLDAPYPVVERQGQLVLVAGFADFTALREAGATWATVFVLEATDERELFELAGALALGGPWANTATSTAVDAKRLGHDP